MFKKIIYPNSIRYKIQMQNFIKKKKEEEPTNVIIRQLVWYIMFFQRYFQFILFACGDCLLLLDQDINQVFSIGED